MTANTQGTPGQLARIALRGILRWRIFVIWIAITLIPTAVISVPMGRLLSEQLDHSAYALIWARGVSVPTLGDLLMSVPDAAPLLRGALVISLLLTLLFWPLLTGMVVASAKSTRTLGFVGLIQGGVSEYGRMLRMLIWSIVPLGIAAAIGGAALKFVSHRAESAILESQVSHEHLIATILLAALLIAAHSTVEAGRAQFALDTGRRSAILAWWRGLRLVLARPVAALGSYIVISLAGLLLIAILGITRINLPHATFCGFLLALLVTQSIAVAAIWMRIARLLALVQLSRPQDLDAAGPQKGLRSAGA
jgi:hypothetical protein